MGDLCQAFDKFIAKDNDPKIAHFISDAENICKKPLSNEEGIKIRLIGHSMGSRVILSALENLSENSTWNANNFKIASVHLMAAAVDNEEASKNQQDVDVDATNWFTVKTTRYGQAIEKEVNDLFSLYSPKDIVLKPNPYYAFYPFQIYPSFEGDWALGYSGYQTVPYDLTLSLPTNYKQINVQNEIPAICDADGDKNPDWPFWLGQTVEFGNNHGGYMGFRNTTDNQKIIDDGAINIVVDN